MIPKKGVKLMKTVKEIRLVQVPRLVPKGGLNPNINKPYFNMEIKIQEMFEFFEQAFCDVPIAIRVEEEINEPQMKPEHVVGFVKKISDTDVVIEVYNNELFDKFKDPRVEICSIINPDMTTNEIYVEKVTKLLLSEYKNPEV